MDPIAMVAVTTIIVAVILIKLSTGSLLVLSGPLLFVALLAVVYTGAIYFYLADPDANIRFLLGMMGTLLLFTLGVILSVLMHRFAPRRENFAYRKKAITDDLKGGKLHALMALMLIAIVMTGVYFILAVREAGTIPLITMLRLEQRIGAIIEERIAFTSVPGAGYFYQFYGVLLPIFGVTFVLKTRVTRKYKIATLSSICSIAFVLMAAGHRAPVWLFGIVILSALSYFYGRVPIGVLVGSLMTMVLVYWSLTLAKYRGDYSQAIQEMVARIFIQALGPQFVFQTFPARSPYMWGESLLLDLAGVLPGRQEGMSSIVPHLRGVKSHNNPTGTIGDVYMNFGPIGLAVFSVVLGWMLQTIHIRMIRGRKTITKVIFGSFLSVVIAYSAWAGLVGTIFQFGALTCGLAYLWLRTLGGMLKRAVS